MIKYIATRSSSYVGHNGKEKVKLCLFSEGPSEREDLNIEVEVPAKKAESFATVLEAAMRAAAADMKDRVARLVENSML